MSLSSLLEEGLVGAIRLTASTRLATPLTSLERIFCTLERTLGWSDDTTPPARLRLWVGPFADPRKYCSNGSEALQKLISICGLQPSSNLLDIGCGCGLLAEPLTHFLDKTARYEGFDIEPHVIEWCTTHITARHPRFQFRRIDVRNSHYNADGAVDGSCLRFPYADNSFDLVVAKSVWTHLLREEASAYLAECARVLRKGGTCWISFFLLNDESRRLIEAGKASMRFSFERDQDHQVNIQSAPEAAVAYEERFVLTLLERYALELVRPIEYGAWSGRTATSDYQDSILAKKR